MRELDRDHAVQRLQMAYAEGLLDAGEMETRLEQALTARTPGTLATALADLPDEQVVLAFLGGRLKRTGAWRVPRTLRLVSEYGHAKLDLSRADIGYPAIEIALELEYGSARLILPRRATVDLSGLQSAWKPPVYRNSTRPGAGTLHVQVSGKMGYGRLKIRHRS
ncbi:DUF1707 domain-containing protein [Nonomuraea typhae]|uniref:DUF1707 domain-containing protein n=1 Tax=Nonomuraea typhae TaxID=2603600 RepID=A0ABW7YVQ1_9ACTN